MRRVVKLVLTLLISSTILIAEFAGGLYIYYASTIPKIPLFQQVDLPQTVEIRSREGRLLDLDGTQYRYSVAMKDVPKALINAFVASEDASFFQHGGLDFKGILRALLTDIFSGRARQGGSTITQQVARNLLLTLHRTMSRKVREAILARRIEDIYTKDEILLLYMNLIYLGEGTYGVQAAARQYFHKDLKDLSISECAVIAALPQSPSRVNPVRDHDGILKKRNRVLRRMLTTKKITKPAYEQALKEKVYGFPAPKQMMNAHAPWVARDALQQARQVITDPGAWQKGLKIRTTVSLGIELEGESDLRRGVWALNRKQGFRGAAWHVDQEKIEQAKQALSAMSLKKDGISLALISNVKKKTAKVLLAGGKTGILKLKPNHRAGKYQEFRRKRGRYRAGHVSFKRRLRDFRKALKVGDIVFVRPSKHGLMLEQPYGMQGAIFAVEPCTGEVICMVGGTDFDHSEFDRSLARRQTGSAIKPVYYARAYDASIPPSMVFSGVPVRIKNWSPDTEDNLRDMTLWEALTVSENNISLRLYQHLLAMIGLDGLRKWYTDLGLPGLPSGFPAQALGIDESPRGLTSAFSTFACQGKRAKTHSLLLVSDKDDSILYDARHWTDPDAGPLDSLFLLRKGKTNATQVMGGDVAYLIAANLRNVVMHGTGRRASRMKHPAFGKTGSLPFDVWFTGWTHQAVTTVWVGADHRERYLGASRNRSGVHGADTALPIWIAFQKAVNKNMPIFDDMKDLPDGVIRVNIDPEWGILASGDQGIEIPHLIGTQPRTFAPAPGGNSDELIWETRF